MAPPNHIEITIPSDHVEPFDYSTRVEWHRAAVLGANDGFVSVASLMMGVGSVRDEGKAVLLTFFAGLFASACSMAIGEFVSMLDIEIAQGERRRNDEDVVEERVVNRFQVTLASAFAFLLGAFAPLIAAAFMTDYTGRVVVVVAATTMALVALGGIVAVVGSPRVAWCCARMVVGGWMAMAITFGVTKLVSASGMEM
ncbi:hypothetical protein ACS0TY_002046 [Phlomoides rotata]